LTIHQLGCGQGNFDCPDGDSDMIGMGHAICQDLSSHSRLAVEAEFVKEKARFSESQADNLVTAAQLAYCPSYALTVAIRTDIPPPNCAPKDWYQICAYPDKHYEVCNMNLNGACQPMMAPSGPLPPGIPSPP
jgi:hypothetical protein